MALGGNPGAGDKKCRHCNASSRNSTTRFHEVEPAQVPVRGKGNKAGSHLCSSCNIKHDRELAKQAAPPPPPAAPPPQPPAPPAAQPIQPAAPVLQPPAPPARTAQDAEDGRALREFLASEGMENLSMADVLARLRLGESVKRADDAMAAGLSEQDQKFFRNVRPVEDFARAINSKKLLPSDPIAQNFTSDARNLHVKSVHGLRFTQCTREKESFDFALSASATQAGRSRKGDSGVEHSVQEAVRKGFIGPGATTQRNVLKAVKQNNLSLNGVVDKAQAQKAFKGVAAGTMVLKSDGTHVKQRLFWVGGKSCGDTTGCDHDALDAKRANLWSPFSQYFIPTSLRKAKPVLARQLPGMASSAPALATLLDHCRAELPLMEAALRAKTDLLAVKLAKGAGDDDIADHSRSESQTC